MGYLSDGVHRPLRRWQDGLASGDPLVGLLEQCQDVILHRTEAHVAHRGELAEQEVAPDAFACGCEVGLLGGQSA